ncbi:MAG TPA: DUF6802 family protein [Pseudonocardiaceae bacterium]|nr:DUF6802 family protein [Pseudonocardiaceae bacterium]
MHFEDQAAVDISVRVGDEEYQADATVDYDGDGIDDTALVPHDDGSTRTVTDVDGDGYADRMTHVDAHGVPVKESWYDAATGEWVDSSGSAGDGRAMAGPGRIGVETPLGTRDLGPAGFDTDGDGVPDTVVVTGPAGGSVLYTDVDADGPADVATEITSDGQVTVSEHAGDGQWTVVERGRLVPDGSYHPAGERADDASTGFGSSGSGSGSAGAAGSPM